MMKPIFSAFGLSLLIACSGPINRLDMSPVSSELQIRSAVSSVMLRDVSLPTYAAAEEIAQEVAPGIIESSADILWADDPARAVTLAMTRHLDGILSATVGPDPWPFVGLPDVAVEVQVSEMVARADGTFHFSGQYYLGGDGIDYPNSSRRFDYSIPLSGEGIDAVALAQGQAILALSEDIARKLGR